MLIGHATVPPLWQKARDQYKASLSAKERLKFEAAFQTTDTIGDVLLAARKAGPAPEALRKLEVVLRPIEALAPIFDVVAQVNGMIGASLWGPLKLVIQVGGRNLDALQKTIEILTIIGTHAERYSLYEAIHSQSKLVREVLKDFYLCVIDFCARAVKYYSRSMTVTSIRSLVKPFNVEFQDVIDDINRIADAVDRNASAEEMRQSRNERESRRVEAEAQANFRQDMRSHIHITNIQETKKMLSDPQGGSFKEELLTRRKEHLPGTCEWFLQDPRFVSWSEDLNGPQSLLIDGNPGSGKSVLASFVISELQGRGKPVVYYFFSMKNNIFGPASALKAILLQILDLDDAFCEICRSELIDSGCSASPTFEVLLQIVRQCIAMLVIPVYFVIDAVDECMDHARFLRALVDICEISPLAKFMITSRRDPDLDESLQHMPLQHGIEHIEMNKENVGRDIEKFVGVSIPNMKRLHRLDFKDLIIQQIVAKSHGMFLWASLMLRELNAEKSVRGIRSRLKRAPAGLFAIYESILTRLHRSGDPSRIEQSRRILKWVTVAAKPLTVNELAIAIAIETSTVSFDEDAVLLSPREDIFDLCGPLVEISEEGVVRMAHLSVMDFLYRGHNLTEQHQGILGKFHFWQNEVSADLAAAMLTLMSFRVYKDIAFREPENVKADLFAEKQEPEFNPSPDILLEASITTWYHYIWQVLESCTDHMVPPTKVERLVRLVGAFATGTNCGLPFLFLTSSDIVDMEFTMLEIVRHVKERGCEYPRELLETPELAVRMAKVRGEGLWLRSAKIKSPGLGVRGESDLAQLYVQKNKHHEARKIYEGIVCSNTFKTARQTDQNLNREMVLCSAALARVDQSEEKYNTAETLLKDAIKESARSFGDKDELTLSLQDQLGELYQLAGKFILAEKLYGNLSEMKSKVFGEHHEKTIRTLAALAQTYSSANWLAREEEVRQKVVKLRTDFFGEDHYLTLEAVTHLAKNRLKLKGWSEAEATLLQYLGQHQEEDNAHIIQILQAKSVLASIYLQAGRYDDAERLAESVLERYRKTFKQKSMSARVADVTEFLGLVHQAQRRWDEAAKLQTDVLRFREDTYIEFNPKERLLAAQYNFALSCWYLNNPYLSRDRDTAQSILVKFLDACVRGAADPNLWHRISNYLSEIAFSKDRLTLPLECWNLPNRTLQKMYRVKYKDADRILYFRLGACIQLLRGNTSEANKLLRKANALLNAETSFGRSDAPDRPALNNDLVLRSNSAGGVDLGLRQPHSDQNSYPLRSNSAGGVELRISPPYSEQDIFPIRVNSAGGVDLRISPPYSEQNAFPIRGNSAGGLDRGVGEHSHDASYSIRRPVVEVGTGEYSEDSPYSIRRPLSSNRQVAFSGTAQYYEPRRYESASGMPHATSGTTRFHERRRLESYTSSPGTSSATTPSHRRPRYGSYHG